MDSTVHDDITTYICVYHKRVSFRKLYRTVDTGHHSISCCMHACYNLSFVCILCRRETIWNMVTLWNVDRNDIVCEWFRCTGSWKIFLNFYLRGLKQNGSTGEQFPLWHRSAQMCCSQPNIFWQVSPHGPISSEHGAFVFCSEKINHLANSNRRNYKPASHMDIPLAIQVDNHHNRLYDISIDKCAVHTDTICYKSCCIAKLDHRNFVPARCCHKDKTVCFSLHTADTYSSRDKLVRTHEFHTLVLTCTAMWNKKLFL